jgi:transcriptional regulator with PAS, ATPase and Fis domain
MDNSKLLISLGMSPVEYPGLNLPANIQLVFANFLELDQVKTLLTSASHILINLNDLSRTQPLDEYSIRSWRESFSDLITKSKKPNGEHAVLVGVVDSGDWNLAKLGLAIGVRQLSLRTELSSQLFNANPTTALETSLPDNVVSMSKANGLPKNIPQNAIPFPVRGLEGSSAASDQLRDLIRRCAPMKTTVLITGEVGVGKRQIARALHGHGKQAQGEFVVVTCANLHRENFETEFYGAQNPGLLDRAKSGSLFLENIDTLEFFCQGQLLRVLEELTSNDAPTRVFASATQNLQILCEEKRFREDLYFRLNVIEIPIPPLRHRRSDLEELCEALLADISRAHQQGRKQLDAQSFEKIFHYDWPGNVRELKNVLEHACLMAESHGRVEILLEDLPLSVQSAEMKNLQKDSLKEAVRRFEREHIHRTLSQFKGSKESTANALGLSLASLYRKLGTG